MEPIATRRRSFTRGLAPLMALAAATTVLFMVPSAGAVTVGTNLGQAPAFGAGCEVSQLGNVLPIPRNCSMFSPVAGQTPRGQWRVVSARVRTGPRAGPMRITMIQALRSKSGAGGVICCTASSQSRVFTPPANSVATVNLNLPAVNTTEVIDREVIEVVDYLGISLLNQTGSVAFVAAQPAATTFFAPAFPTGATRLGGAIPYSVVPMINARFQSCRASASGASVSATPCAPRRFSVSPRARVVRRGTLGRFTARVPTRGTLRVGQIGSGPKLVGSAARRATKPGGLRLNIKLNARGRKALSRRGVVQARVRVSFRPRIGRAYTQILRVTFRR